MIEPTEESVYSGFTSATANSLDEHRGLVATALVISLVAALGAFSFGWNRESILLIAVALTTSLSTLATGLTLDAISIRRKQRQWKEGGGLPATPERTPVDPSQINVPLEHDPLHEMKESLGMHPVFMGIPAGVVLFLALFQLWGSFVKSHAPLPAVLGTAAGVVCLVAACLWIVLAKSFQATAAEDLPEGQALSQAFRESQWSALFAFGALIIDQGVSGTALWIARLLLVWTAVVSAEQLLRTAGLWFANEALDKDFVSPLQSLLREAFLIRGNPLGSLFDTLEKRYGVSLRSSWSISFLRQAVWPVLALFLLFSWGLTALTIVEPHQVGLRETCGRLDRERLDPGLHWQWPWPFGRVVRYPVRTINTMQIGFRDEDLGKPVDYGKPRALLWTRPHPQEFGLVLGTGSEMVAVNAIVYYKIHDDLSRLLDFAYGTQNPTEKLEAYAYRSLMELTRTTQLSQILSANRAEFSHQLESSLRDYAERNHLGLDVVSVSLINLHPPVETAPNYLDVISARLDANRLEIEANGKKLSQLQQAEAERDGLISQAKVEAARRIGIAGQESSQFLAVGQSFALAPENFRLRLWLEALEETLGPKKLYLFDRSLLGKTGEVLLDLRPPMQNRQDESIPSSGKK